MNKLSRNAMQKTLQLLLFNSASLVCLIVSGISLNIMLSSTVKAHEIRPAYLNLTEIVEAKTVPNQSSKNNTTPEVQYAVLWKQPIRAGQAVAIAPRFPDGCEEGQRGLAENVNLSRVHRYTISCKMMDMHGKEISISGLDSTLVNVFVELNFANKSIQSVILRPSSAAFTVDLHVKISGQTSYLTLGVEHLLQGFDHILFIIALVLLVRRAGELVKVVTAFTLAHSITLALSTLGLVSLSQPSVEALIALSIVFLAVELVRLYESKDLPAKSLSIIMEFPWVISFIFGLLHGFGFAGALAQIGLPETSTAMALLLFNLGVEAGQLMIVAVMLVLLALYAPIKAKLPPSTALIPAYIIGTFGGFWFIERSLGVMGTI